MAKTGVPIILDAREKLDDIETWGETEDYCDQKLKNFESTLGEAKDVIAAGRRKLQETGTGRHQENFENDLHETEVIESSSSSGLSLIHI